MHKKVHDPYIKEKVEWGMVPYVQAMLLARYLRGNLDGYPVFLWNEVQKLKRDLQQM